MWKANMASIGASTLVLAVIVCAPASAQPMYRCGSSYQAHPCETGQGKTIGSVGARQSSYSPVANAECAQRGAESLKISWAREAGLIKEKAQVEVEGKRISASQKADAAKLIADVYNKRGSAPEVRAAIEAECVIEKEREAQAMALYRAANPASQKQTAADGLAKGAESPTGSEPIRRPTLANNDASVKKLHCSNQRRELDEIERRLRAGAAVHEIEKLRQERADLERSQVDSGC